MPRDQVESDLRTSLLDAALRLFHERGYNGVGLEELAKEVGVTRQTVYNQFGSKGGLLRALAAFDEDRANLPEHLGKVFASTDGLAMLRAMLDTVVAVEPVVRATSRIVYAERLGDKSAAELWNNRMNSRLMGMTMVMNRLNADGLLKPGLGPEEAAEIAWSIASPHMYECLVIDRGWSLERYRSHLEAIITAAVLRKQ